MTELTILVPVLDRPHRVEPVLRSAQETVPDADILFIADPDDTDQLETLTLAGADFIAPGGTYAEKINLGVRECDTPLVFTGADDITFLPGWYEAAKRRITDRIRVIGVTDTVTRRNARGHHAPHFLIARDYALQPTIDGGRGPLCELYGHCFCDSEFIETARKRDVLYIARDARVKHHHFLDGSAKRDETYEKGQSTYRQDAKLFRERRRLWR